MRSTNRNDREQLEQELQGSAYQTLLRKLQRKHLFLRRFRTWADVIAFMWNGTSTDPRMDEILRPIFKAHADDSDPRWRTILMAIFWPALTSLHTRKGHWDKDADELWSNICWTFLKVICRVNVERRPDRLVQKVFNETFHHLYEEYQRIWKRAKREPVLDPEAIEALAVAVEGIDFEGIDLRKAYQREVNRLQQHRDAGRITEADFLLLVGTRLYGQSIAEYACGAGLKMEAAKKRRQRAEAAILNYEKNLR